MKLRKYFLVLGVFNLLRVRGGGVDYYVRHAPVITVVSIVLLNIILRKLGFTLNARGFVEGVNGLLGVLVGFYIAALAAISGSNNVHLDKLMRGVPPKIKIFKAGRWVDESLTRRRFLSFLFGYCAVMSILCYIMGLLRSNLSFSNFSDLEKFIFGFDFYLTISNLFWLVYLWLISSLFVSTLLGLYYLADRMNRDDS